jgi:hypothetical protein
MAGAIVGRRDNPSSPSRRVGEATANSIDPADILQGTGTFAPNKVKCLSLRDLLSALYSRNLLRPCLCQTNSHHTESIAGVPVRDQEQGSAFKDLLHYTLGATPLCPCMFWRFQAHTINFSAASLGANSIVHYDHFLPCITHARAIRI